MTKTDDGWSKYLALHYTKFKLFTKRQNFTLDQIERICSRKNKCDLKIKIWLGKNRKHCEKRSAGYHHFLFFPQCFQKLSFPELLIVGFVW